MMFDLRGVKIYYGDKEVTAGYLGGRQFFGEDPIPWVLATDDDFSGTANGRFKYIGNDLYVEIPHVIKGVNVTSYYKMFEGSNVMGVKSTNNKVTNMREMFTWQRSPHLDLRYLDTSSVTNMFKMFFAGYFKSLDLRGWDTSSVTDMDGMFWGLFSRVEILDLSSFTLTSRVDLSRWIRNLKAKVLDVSGMDFVKYAAGNTTDMFHGVNLDVGYALNQENADWLNARISGSPFIVKPKGGI